VIPLEDEDGNHAAYDGGLPRWSATRPARDDALDNLMLRGSHDLRYTFSAWLEDAGIPAKVIYELMGHAGGHRSGGEGNDRRLLPAHHPGDGGPCGGRHRAAVGRRPPGVCYRPGSCL